MAYLTLTLIQYYGRYLIQTKNTFEKYIVIGRDTVEGMVHTASLSANFIITRNQYDNDKLPNRICAECSQKLEDCYNFCIIVNQNESLLQEHLINNTLNILFQNLEDCKYNKDDIDNKENIVNDGKENVSGVYDNDEAYVIIKDEISSPDEHIYSSDELTLSTIKSLKDKSQIKKKKYTKKGKEKETLKKENLKNGIDKFLFPDGTPEDEKQWKCLTCFQLFDKRSYLREHYKQHSLVKTKDLNHFKKDVHEDSCNSYKCGKCDKEFENKQLFTQHKILHQDDRPFVCNLCGRTYRLLSDIIRHGRVHSGVKPLVCKYNDCGYSTAYYGALKSHEQRHCPEQYKYSCDKCGKGFNVKTWYEQHQNYHTGQKPFVCDICGNAYFMAKYLKTHRNSAHPEASNQRRHICVHCGISCDNRTVLNTHLKEHGFTKSFLCDICGKSLSNFEHLKFHRNIHLGEKPHACSTCGKAFVKKSNLKLHERIHTGLKPYVCGHCGKAFSQNSTLVVHTRYHTGSRPYECRICSKSFVCRSKLSTHQKSCI